MISNNEKNNIHTFTLKICKQKIFYRMKSVNSATQLFLWFIIKCIIIIYIKINQINDMENLVYHNEQDKIFILNTE